MKNLPILKQFIQDSQDAELIPICPRLIDLFVDFTYKGGYTAYQIQTASREFRKSLYRSFLSQLSPEERQLTVFDEIQLSELK